LSHYNFDKPNTAWSIISRSKREAAIGLGLGVAIAAGAKYLAAGLLIIWLLAGGS
jgi:hypothetical protein